MSATHIFDRIIEQCQAWLNNDFNDMASNASTNQLLSSGHNAAPDSAFKVIYRILKTILISFFEKRILATVEASTIRS